MPAENKQAKRAYRKTAETQEIIFDAAMKLMSEKGFQGTTVREICASAGIPIGTFYNCYKSKVEILKRIYDTGDAFIQSAELPEEDHASAMDRLRLFADSYATLNERTGIEVMRVLFYPSNEWFSMDRPMQTLAKRIIQEGQNAGEIRRDFSADTLVGSFFDILRGASYNWCIYDGAFDLKARISLQMELFCKSIAAL